MDEVRARVREWLQTTGASSLADIGAFLSREGHEIGQDLQALDEFLVPYEEPEWSPGELHDGRFIDTPTVLDGIVLTTRLRETEIEAGSPRFSPDLDPLLDLLTPEGRLPLATGGELTLDLTDLGWELDGPAGWMPGEPGDVLVLRLADGQLHASTMDPAEVDPDTTQEYADRLAEVHGLVRKQLAGVELADLVVETRVRHPLAWSSPVLPLEEMVELAGLARRGDWVAYPEELDDEGNLAETSIFAGLTDHLVNDHGMTTGQADEFVQLTVMTEAVMLAPPLDLDEWERRVLEAARAAAGQPTIEEEREADPVMVEEAVDFAQTLPALARILADDQIAQFVPDDLLVENPKAAAALAVLTRRVAQGSRDRLAQSNAWWLHGQALEFLEEDGAAVERAFRRALEASADHVGAATDLAWCLNDRGRAGAALGQLASHGLADAEWATELDGWAQPGPTTAKRNEPCPCGSGRKHKVCCAQRNGWPLIDRVDWVFSKLARFGGRPSNLGLILLVAMDVGAASDSVAGLSEDPVEASLCLFEGGLIAQMCEQRGPLLPADELDLLRQWEQVRAGAYEVVSTEPGKSMVLLDLHTGDRHDVTERSASQQLEPGTSLMTWLVPYPDGTTRVALGAAHVPLQKRPSLLDVIARDPGVRDLASWYRSLYAPPRMQNTDGEPMVLCEVRISTPGDRSANEAALTAAGLVEAGDGVFHQIREREEDTVMIGSIQIVGPELLLQTNSSHRMDALVDAAQTAIDGATVIDDVRTPIHEMMATAQEHGVELGLGEEFELEVGEELPSGGLDLDAMDDLDPEEADEIREAVRAWMERTEEEWCDEAIPALGGLTPRQAVDDPTRRSDLLALLAEMPPSDAAAPGGPIGMDPDRLRALLGLPQDG